MNAQHTDSQRLAHFEMNCKDHQRLQSLHKERLLEIKRQGIHVTLYHSHQILPAFVQCAIRDIPKLKSMLQLKISLQLCNQQGMPILNIPKISYFTKKQQQVDMCRVYLADKSRFRQMPERSRYILVKNNATIGVLRKLLQSKLQGERYFHKIEDFIFDQNCTKIDLDESLKLQFNEQSDLNKQQNLAIKKSFQNHLTFIKGPPGCGKTRTISRMVKMFAQQGLKVLVGSISNVANQKLISEIIEQVEEHNHLRKQFPQMRMKKLRLIINYSRVALGKLSQNLKRYSINNQLFKYFVKINTSLHYHEENIMGYIDMFQKGQTVPKDFYAIYRQSFDELTRSVNITITTTINSFKIYKYTQFKPDVGILDEAAQASWTDTYGFLTFGIKRMVFVGDQKQLAPTVIGDCNGNKILKETIFGAIAEKNPQYFVYLKTQYRMLPQISEFPNQFIYKNKLQNAELTQRYSQIQYFKMYPISFIRHDSPQTICEELQNFNSNKGVKQYSNLFQISLILDILQTVPYEQIPNIGILTFYDRQCQLLIDSLASMVNDFGLTIKTIDGYQGGEKDYVIISTVRSNDQNNPGFCIQENRVNVALTRAKIGLIVLGNPQTLMQGRKLQDENHNIWGKYCKYMDTKGKLIFSDHFSKTLSTIRQKYVFQQKIRKLYQELQETYHHLTSIGDINQEKSSQNIQNKDKEHNQAVKKFDFSIFVSYNEDLQKIRASKLNVYFATIQKKQVQQHDETISLDRIQNSVFKEKVFQLISERFTFKIAQNCIHFVHDLLISIYNFQIVKTQPCLSYADFFGNLCEKISQEQQIIIQQSLNYLVVKGKTLISSISAVQQSQIQKYVKEQKQKYSLLCLIKSQIKCNILSKTIEINKI